MMRMGDLTKKRRGRPQRNREFLEYIISRTVYACEKHGFKGHGAGKRALAKWLGDEAKETNRSQVRVAAQLPKFQKLLSEAKRKFPEIAAKLPR